MSSTWWIESPYPRTVRGIDLISNKREFVLDPEKPPEDTSYSGMKMLYVREVTGDGKKPGEWLVYKVMVTEQDITTAIGCMQEHKAFQFVEGKKKGYATIVLSRKGAKCQ